MSEGLILETRALCKTFKPRRTGGKTALVDAVKGVDLSVKAEEIFGFLGPNGAGKTTLLRMLTTLLPPTSGAATVAGFDLHKQPKEIRKQIGYVSQSGGADLSATAREDLMLHARLYGMTRDHASSRAAELLERLQMIEFADRQVTTYSGGQRRRLDLALGIVHKPRLLFLDEPTLGLDPQSRAYFWEEIKRLRAEGTTVFLTTHYLDEADKLCDRLSIIDHGLIVVEGTPDELKREIKGDSVVLGIEDGQHVSKAKTELSKQPYVREVLATDDGLHLYVDQGDQNLPAIIRLLDSQQIRLQTIELSKPSLDDVFLQKTGRTLREDKDV